MARRAAPLPRGAGADSTSLAADCAFDFRRGRAAAARLPRPRPSHRGDLAARAGRQEGPAALRPASTPSGSAAPTPRSRTSWTVIERPGLPRLLPDRPRHRQVLRGSGHPVPGPWLGRELGRLLRAAGSPASIPFGTSCCSSGSCRPAGTGRPTSTWTSSTAAARRSSSTSTASTAGSKAAQVANVISYRPRMALRDAGRALGYPPEQQDRWSEAGRAARVRGPASRSRRTRSVPGPVVALAARMQRLPRHLGIHSGGMVICDRPVGEVCPVEWARMPGRTVLQWDKDDCASRAGQVRPARPGHAHRAAGLLRAGRGAPRRRAGTCTRSRRRTPASTTCSARPTRSGCSRSSPAPRWRRCPGCGRGSSTTWWWRWR